MQGGAPVLERQGTPVTARHQPQLQVPALTASLARTERRFYYSLQLYYNILYYNILYYNILYSTILYYIVL